MLRWLRRGTDGPAADIPRIGSPEELDQLLAAELVVFFKHSPTCSVSWAAHQQVKRYLGAHPGAPFHLISVRQDFDLSQRIAQVSGIPHASPQIIVMRNGEVVADASHEEITGDHIGEMLTAASNPVR